MVVVVYGYIRVTHQQIMTVECSSIYLESFSKTITRITSLTRSRGRIIHVSEVRQTYGRLSHMSHVLYVQPDVPSSPMSHMTPYLPTLDNISTERGHEQVRSSLQ
jgi:hypothetical protein